MGCKKMIRLGLSVLLLTCSDVIASIDLPSWQMADRADYWTAHGRFDLAEQHATSQAAETGNGANRASLVAVSNDAASGDIVGRITPAGGQGEGAVIAGSKFAQTDRRQQADYWRQRGRSDLADALTDQTYSRPYSRESHLISERDTSVVARPRVTDEVVQETLSPITRTMPRSYATTRSPDQDEAAKRADGVLAQKSRVIPRNLADSAEYWQRRGRPDMADWFRPHLQSDQPPLQQYSRTAQQTARMDVVQVSHTNLSDALFAIAQLYVDQQMWRDALQILEKISPISRSAEMERLQRSVWTHVQIERADVLIRQGRNAEAKMLLQRVATELAINPSSANLAEPPPLWGACGVSRQR